MDDKQITNELVELGTELAMDKFIGTAVANSGDASKVVVSPTDFVGSIVLGDSSDEPVSRTSVSVSTLSNHYMNTLPVISPEKAAFVLLKILSARPLTTTEHELLPQVMDFVVTIIGADASKLLLKHILKDKLIFKDEELMERCITQLQRDMDEMPVMTAFLNVGEPIQPQTTWIKPYTDEVIITSENTGSSGDATIEKPETSGTIGQR